MGLRDHFAAAALTGLVGECGYNSPEDVAGEAYALADAMLCEQEKSNAASSASAPPRSYEKTDEKRVLYDTIWADKRTSFSHTNHDAAPAATARTDADRDRSDKAAARPGEGTGDICHRLRYEVAWEPEVGALMDEAADEIERLRLSAAEIDALEHVVDEGQIACLRDYGALRSLLIRVRPEWEAK